MDLHISQVAAQQSWDQYSFKRGLLVLLERMKLAWQGSGDLRRTLGKKETRQEMEVRKVARKIDSKYKVKHEWAAW